MLEFAQSPQENGAANIATPIGSSKSLVKTNWISITTTIEDIAYPLGCPPPRNSGNEGLGWDSRILKMVHNPGGDWHPARGDNPTYPCVGSISQVDPSDIFQDDRFMGLNDGENPCRYQQNL